MEEVPDITVELESRPSILLESTLAGGLAGVTLLVLVELGVAVSGAVGYPHLFATSLGALDWVFHATYATAFGSIFGLLADSGTRWRYGRGVLGPFVGAAFGVTLWVIANVVFWPLWLGGLHLSFGSLPSGMGFVGVPLEVAVVTYAAYGVLLGLFTNAAGLLEF